MVAKAEWGQKRICPSCSGRYYDMRKNPPICPSCGTKFDPETLLKSRRIRTVTEAKRVDVKRAPEPVPLAAVAVESEDVIEADVKVEDGLIEDAAELGGDDDEVEVEEEEA